MPTLLETPNGERFTIIPEADYFELLRQVHAEVSLPASVMDESDLVDADDFVAVNLGRDLRAARMAAGLTQGQLARRMRKSQSLVSAAERGAIEVGVHYVERVLKACRLPANWKPATTGL